MNNVRKIANNNWMTLMVNLCSDGMPDLTKEYMPKRRQTKDLRIGPWRIGLQSLQTWVDEISENMIDSSDQVSGVSEEILMRLEIAKLQQEVEMIRASREILIINTDSNEINEDLANYLQKKDRTIVIMKILTEFRDQVKHIKKSVILIDSVNYSI
ncbi:hypothetical protein PAAG_11674 [Paracoccidioides lutzii Pb01]|uniref:Uncharacterized protein n=1 Tax=Paracoccidioides lutzii (strain ATCC MYA-826 / Pb01) TaxID=502779 RepID=A0A0A2V172_PARBA|nr:hypothetical protein PAAG_11674 [Paracoccidioides lutzii Pb01]KGQ01551.1 hypothetical protein PAAG_11674 [Paracoccidioides lutzii Pb01]